MGDSTVTTLDADFRAADSEEEWRDWNRLGDPVMHIDLRNWADLLLVAPLSAHTLAKIAHGLCDDVLGSVIRAWDFGHGNSIATKNSTTGSTSRRGKPLVLAPAMNTAMWQHPLTRQQLDTICGFWNNTECRQCNDEKTGVSILHPQVKTLACGEVGDGALASVDEILQKVGEQVARFARN
jgi:phosphopantothenoylcysteine decarboxylase